MNKLFKSIVAASVGVAMAIGVGAGLGREASAVCAESSQTLTTNTLSGVSSDANIAWTAIKGSSNNAPAIYNSGIRLYQNGGFIQLEGKNGAKINSFTAHNTNTYATTANYAVSESAFSTSSTPSGIGTDTSVAKSGTYTITGLDSTYVAIINKGTTSSNRFEISSIDVTFTGGSTQVQTYTVTYDANGGTGSMTDTSSPYVSGATVTVLGNEFTRENYTFTKWNTVANGSGIDYLEDSTFTINADITLYAQWEENVPGRLVFDLTSNPGDWPTTNSTTLTNYAYSLNNVDYTFALKNVKQNSGYLMMTKVAVLGLPAISNQKLTKVVANNSSDCSVSVNVGISSSSSSESYVDGGAKQTWSTKGSSYTYNLSNTNVNTVYYLYVTTANAQVTKLTLTYEEVNVSDVFTVTYDANGATAGNPPTDSNEYHIGEEATVLGNTGGLEKDDCLFAGWNTAADGNGTTYTSGNTITINGNTTLYAKWDVDPNSIPGTENKPYTVAQARAAIDAGTGLNGVYASGIVSQVDSYNSTYNSITYWISDDGTTTNQLQVYSGKGLNNTNFTNINGVVVGATVTVYGTLKKYNSTYEFDKNNYLTSYTAPDVGPATDISLDKDTLEVGVGYSKQLTATKTPAGASGDVTWESGNEGVATVDENGFVSGVSAGTTTISAKCGSLTSDPCTITVTPISNYGSETNPLTVDEAIELLKLFGNNVSLQQLVVEGTVSENTYDETNDYGNVWLQNESGSAAKSFELFHCVIDADSVEDASNYKGANLLAGCRIVATGYAKVFNGTYELSNENNVPPSIISVIPPVRVLSSITVSGQTTEFVVDQSFSFDGVVTAHYEDGSEKAIISGFTVSEPDMSTAGTKTITITYEENEVEKTATYDITVSVAPVIAIEETGLFVKVTDDSGLIDGAKYLIVSNDSSIVFDGSRETLDAGVNGISAAKSNLENILKAYFVINLTSNGASIKSASGYYIGNNENNNKLKTSNTDPFNNVITFNSGNAVITSEDECTTLRYNNASGDSNQRFRYYKSGQQEIQLYRFVDLSASRIASIRGEAVTSNGEVTAVNSLTLRFGVKIPKAKWDALNGITEFGIKMFLCSKEKLATAPAVEDASSVSTISKNASVPAEDGQGNYNFFVTIEVPDTLPSPLGFRYDSYVCARPYIKIGDQIVWLLEEDIQESIISLAKAGNNTNLSQDALTWLKNKEE